MQWAGRRRQAENEEGGTESEEGETELKSGVPGRSVQVLMEKRTPFERGKQVGSGKGHCDEPKGGG